MNVVKVARVTLLGAGVALKAGTLVASPDNATLDFYGQWQNSSLALDANQQPEHFIS